MLQRFAVVIYIFLHLAILVAVTYEVGDSYAWNTIGVEYFNVRCNENGKLVVLQGASEPHEFGGHLYKTRYSNAVSRNWFDQEEETMRFYCKHYDEIEKHIVAYQQASNGSERYEANLAYRSFSDANIAPIYTNYKLELIRVENDWLNLFYSFLGWVGYALFLFGLLQLVRIIYQYIVHGAFRWHPYRQLKK